MGSSQAAEGQDEAGHGHAGGAAVEHGGVDVVEDWVVCDGARHKLDGNVAGLLG
jgi:hypothetical protein